MKYKEWLNIWLMNYVRPTAKPKTYDSYKHIVEKHISKKLGDKDLNEITPILLQSFLTELLQSGNLLTGGGLSTSTVNLIITVVQNSLKSAFICGEIKEYLANRVKRPKLRQKDISCFNLIEQRKIEQAILTGKNEKMLGIVLCLYTGLRIGELLALTWADLDLSKGIITVNKTCHDGKVGDKHFGRITNEPKTESSKRKIPIPKQLILILREKKKDKESRYVIEGNGKPLTIRSYQRSFESLLKKLQIEHKGFHSLRHTFATRALETGMDVKALAEILGHKNAAITLNRYVHSLMEHKQEMMNRLGKMLI